MSGRHTGGVRGTRLIRANCPLCGRDTAGGTADRARTQIWLKPHKRPGPQRSTARPWCPGGGKVVSWR